MKPAANYPEEPGRGHPLAYTLEASLRSGLVHVEHRNVLEGTRFHTQPGIEIHLTLEGRALFHVAGRNYLQTTRQGLIFWGRHPHQIVADRTYPFQRINIGFVPGDFAVRIRGGAAFLLDWVPKSEAFSFALSEGDFARFDELSRRLRSEVNLRLQGWQDAVLGCVLGLLTLVRRNGTGGGPGGGGGDVRRGGRRGELVNQACSHVRNNLAERLALGDVASHFKITPEHLTRSFQRQLGVSFHRYVLAERIAQAKERLRNQPGATVTDIAFECGFVSSDHFGKVFKRHTLMTPSEFRETQA